MSAARLIGPLVLAGGVAAAIACAPTALAEPLLPTCEGVGADSASGGQNTECATPGNVQIDTSPPVYPYPYYDEFYGPGFVI